MASAIAVVRQVRASGGRKGRNSPTADRGDGRYMVYIGRAIDSFESPAPVSPTDAGHQDHASSNNRRLRVDEKRIDVVYSPGRKYVELCVLSNCLSIFQ